MAKAGCAPDEMDAKSMPMSKGKAKTKATPVGKSKSKAKAGKKLPPWLQKKGK